MDIQRAINYYGNPLGSRLPYGVMPGSVPGGLDSEFDEYPAGWPISGIRRRVLRTLPNLLSPTR